jgi:predicted O-linked N-acetylglucosamine transferase (SPINDLY family)
LSYDFRHHAISILMAELFELHDRNRFEVIGISYGPDDQSELRRRVSAAFDRFIDVRTRSDADVAAQLAEMEVDIAVDLNAHTQFGRPAILAFRPSPVQVNYLGYPGTIGAPFIDYILGDRIVTPPEHEGYYSEKIAALPNCYQANDSKRRISPQTATRAECGLPPDGLVFCCFNNSYKITAEVFEAWMRLLERVDASVLWLLDDNRSACANLTGAAAARGIDPARLVFAPRVTAEQHLARHRLADLFLDTFPYNAHTTASDALWAGLPIVTRMGETFASRVCASALHAAGLPELVTHNLRAYEELALSLALDSRRLQQLRSQLAVNIPTCPLFDSRQFCRDLETAFETMCEIHNRGEKPRSFAVQ